jgi:hypothetical protein
MDFLWFANEATADSSRTSSKSPEQSGDPKSRMQLVPGGRLQDVSL